MHLIRPPLDQKYHDVYFTGAKLKAKSTDNRVCVLQFGWKVTVGIAQSLPQIVRHVWPALMGADAAIGVDLNTVIKSQNFHFRSTPASPLALLELKGYPVILTRLELGDGKEMAVLRFEIETALTQSIGDLIVALLGAQISMQACEGQAELAQPPAEVEPKSADEDIFTTETVDPAKSKCDECGCSFGVHLKTCSRFRKPGFAEQADKAERDREAKKKPAVSTTTEKERKDKPKVKGKAAGR